MPLQPFEQSFISQGGTSRSYDVNPPTTDKRGVATNIEAFVNGNATATGFFLLGHSAGSDAVIWAASDLIAAGRSSRIKAVAILDSDLIANNQQRGDTVANGNTVASTIPTFAGESDEYRRRFGVTGFPTNVSIMPYNLDSHHALADDSNAAQDVTAFFLQHVP